MAQSLIRWKKGDYIRLGKAVSDFNKRIKELESIDVDYLPDLKNYKDIKSEILSRNELNRVLKSLRSFSKEGMNKPVDLPSGSTITEWEYEEVKKARKISVKRLESEKLAIKLGEKYVGMGDERIDTINSTIKNIEQFETLKDFEFKDTKERVLKLGSKDYELRKAMIYRENFMNSLGEMSTYDNYDKLVKRLDKISNPIKFYEFIQKSDTLSDLFLYYKDKATAQTYGGFTSNQDAFNYALEELGIAIDTNKKNKVEKITTKQIYDNKDLIELKNIDIATGYIVLYSNGEKVGRFSSGDLAYKYIKSRKLTNITYNLEK